MNFGVIQLLKFKTIILIFVIILPISLNAKDSFVLSINTSEGGENSQRRLDDFKEYLNQQNCTISEIRTTTNSSLEFEAGLVFTPLKSKSSKKYQQVLNLKVTNDAALSSSVLVRASTGIDQLKALSGEHIAFISEDSITGYKLAQELFQQAGVDHHKDKIIFTQTNIGAMSLLIHKDAFVAVVATPLATKWAKSNDFKIVATSKEVQAGGLLALKSINPEQLNNCKKAFKALSEKTRKNKKLLKVFPAWVDEFVEK